MDRKIKKTQKPPQKIKNHYGKQKATCYSVNFWYLTKTKIFLSGGNSTLDGKSEA